ncbi:hypothetical protein BATDEDRAFT_91638 [Batrachochytrium dendrobatidis JAM81]|uniref:HMA domain-containing protein n=1 Tax=Batrachochytrium dendrobatidis (strain JAM81 / FGSC 10211) TaxID=684364 RepID=F4PB99_BATDJ|nr:uncharacterized protein BATDEDRAFT_91638 [Batrachochytrium dendrobatidis JAM81]EGF77289.1 hypothetical protein BATDEDRAFT_91638 [Batrachochytrium dendrobatidis JAM81]|eukprot:XP_006682031.1 hypothetical protein BATDEDRAFT_91638 [Batrachochytrium dendrobatidis JAM81]
MTCSGCSSAIERILKKTEGVSSYDICIDTQIVQVKTTRSQQEIFDIIKKSGKPVEIQ